MLYKQHNTERNSYRQQNSLSTAYKYKTIPASSKLVRLPNPILHPDVIKDPIKYISSLSKTKREIIRYLTEQKARFSIIYCSQSTIANWLGVTRETINIALKDLIYAGLIGSYYRHMNTCLYNLSSIFFNPRLRDGLKGIVSLALLLSISQLLSAPGIDGKKAHYYGIVYNDLTQLFKAESVFKYLADCNYQRREYSKFISMPAVIKTAKKEQKVFKVKHEVENIQSLSLSTAGKHRLCAFPGAAIMHADSQIQQFSDFKKSKIENPFGLFFKMCVDYCRAHNLTIEWDITFGLNQQHGIEVDAPMVTSNKIITPTSYNSDQYASASTNTHLEFEEQPAVWKKEYKKGRTLKEQRAQEEYDKRESGRPKTKPDMIAHNKRLVEPFTRKQESNSFKPEEFNPISKVLQREKEILPSMSPEQATRITDRVQEYLKILGIDQEGSTLDKSNPPTIQKLISAMNRSFE